MHACCIGRDAHAGGDLHSGFLELQSSVFSACLHASRPLQLHVFLAPEDMSPGKSGLQRCNLCWLAATCIAARRSRHHVPRRPDDSSAGSNVNKSISGGAKATNMPDTPDTPVARIMVHSLNATVLRWFMDELGVVGYGHHSTWFGYSKLWLPRLLPDVEWAAFVDTDTIFVKDPWELLDIRLKMSDVQTIAASRIVGDPMTGASLGFTHRINSGNIRQLRHHCPMASPITSRVTANNLLRKDQLILAPPQPSPAPNRSDSRCHERRRHARVPRRQVYSNSMIMTC